MFGYACDPVVPSGSIRVIWRHLRWQQGVLRQQRGLVHICKEIEAGVFWCKEHRYQQGALNGSATDAKQCHSAPRQGTPRGVHQAEQAVMGGFMELSLRQDGKESHQRLLAECLLWLRGISGQQVMSYAPPGDGTTLCERIQHCKNFYP